MYRLQIVALILIATFGLGLSGCSSEPEAPATSTQASEPSNGHSHSQEELDKMKAAMAELSPEDAEAAMKQHHCVVSGELLGSMGAPKKVDVEGTPVWICCDGCKDTLLADPEKHLAKLGGEKAK